MQTFWYEFINGELVMYLIDEEERCITKIPNGYEGLYKHIKGNHISVLFTLEDLIIRHKLVWKDFNDL